MNKRTKALQITPSVKRKVYERDNGLCVLCGAPGDPVCHVVSRAQGGMGIEENVVTLCSACHAAYDQSVSRKRMREIIIEHLKNHYSNWEEKKVIYRKE